jgi:4-alpha-glucanotransferase
VQTAYYNTRGRRQQAEPETLLTVLRLLGAPLITYDEVDAALRLRRQVLWQRGIEPVIVSWDGHPTILDLRLPATHASTALMRRIYTETGEEIYWDVDLATAAPLFTIDVEGVTYHTKRLSIAEPLPVGYHRLTVDVSPQHVAALLIAAPQRAYTPDEHVASKTCPEALAEWLAELGRGVIAILPLLSSFFPHAIDPSPYVPAGRVFWNECYIDVTRAPGLEECAAAQEQRNTVQTQALLTSLRAAPLVDYQQQMALKRQVLEPLADWFFASTQGRQEAFPQYVLTHSAVEDCSVRSPSVPSITYVDKG